MTLQERAPCDCVPQSLSRGASTAAAAVLERKGGYPTVQNSPVRLSDVGLGPRVGLPGRRQPAGYGTSWSVLVSGTSGRSGSSEPNLFSPFPYTNPPTPPILLFPHIFRCPIDPLHPVHPLHPAHPCVLRILFQGHRAESLTELLQPFWTKRLTLTPHP